MICVTCQAAIVDQPAHYRGEDGPYHGNCMRTDVKCYCVGDYGPNPDCGCCGGDGVCSGGCYGSGYQVQP
jgi:hypothetical protein